MGYFDDTKRILSNALDSIDGDQMDQLVEHCSRTLDQGKKIIVSGLGKNVPICEKFVGTMISLGMEAYYLNTNSAVHGDMGIAQDGDLVIILTKSGETAESIYLVDKLSGRKLDMWLITFSEKSTLTDKIENSLVIRLEHEGDMWDMVPNNSTTLNLIVLQTVAMRLAEKRNISLAEFKQNHPGGNIGKVLSTR